MQTYTSVEVSDGFFSIEIGPALPTLSTAPYLELTVQGQLLSPRQKLIVMPFAIEAIDSQTAQFATEAQNATTAQEAQNSQTLQGSTPDEIRTNLLSEIGVNLGSAGVNLGISTLDAQTISGQSASIEQIQGTTLEMNTVLADVVDAGRFIGDGSSLTNVWRTTDEISAPYVEAVTLSDGSGLWTQGKISVNEVDASTVTADFFVGDGSGLTGVGSSNLLHSGNTSVEIDTTATGVGEHIHVNVDGVETMFITSMGVGVLVSSPSAAMEVAGTVAADFFVGDGSGLSGVVLQGASISTTQVEATTFSDGIALLSGGLLYVSGIEAGGTVTASAFVGDGSGLSGVLKAGEDISVGVLEGVTLTDGSAYLMGGNLVVTSIDSSGTVTASTFVGDGSNLTGLLIAGQDVSAPVVFATTFVGDGSSLTGVHIAGQDISAPNIFASTFVAANSISVGGAELLSSGNLAVQNVDVTGTVTAAAFVGDASGLINFPTPAAISSGNTTIEIDTTTPGTQEHIHVFVDSVERLFITSQGVGIGVTFPSEALEVGGNISADQITVQTASAVEISASSFLGDGTGLSGVLHPGDAISTSETLTLSGDGGKGIVIEHAAQESANTTKIVIRGASGSDHFRVDVEGDVFSGTLDVLDTTISGFLRHSSSTLYGVNSNTHVNLGTFSESGTSGSSYGNISITGGQSNVAANDFASIGAGLKNTASGYNSRIGGGEQNLAGGHYSVVAGGGLNEAIGTGSSISGGQINTAGGSFSVVGGGKSNVAQGDYSTIAGGEGNIVTGDYSIIPGGSLLFLQAGDAFGFNGTGTSQTVTSGLTGAAIFMVSRLGVGTTDPNPAYMAEFNGDINVIGKIYENGSIVNAGTSSPWTDNSTNISYSAGNVGIGTTTPLEKLEINGAILLGNTGNNYAGSIRFDGTNFEGFDGGSWLNLSSGGGSAGASGTGENSFIGAGTGNSASSTYVFIGAGSGNTASATSAFVGAGEFNEASGGWSSVVGGLQNTGTGSYSFIGGGQQNQAASTSTFVGGGEQNTVSGAWSAVLGGKNNVVGGQVSVIPGGQNMTVNSDKTFAFNGSPNSIIVSDPYSRGIFFVDHFSVNTESTFAMFEVSANSETELMILRDESGNVDFVVDAGGRVGIGTDSPGPILDVVGNIGASGDITASGNLIGTLSTGAQPNITSVGTLATADIDGGTLDDVIIGATSAATASFTDLTASGNASIGTTGSFGKLTVDGDLISIYRNAAAGKARYHLYNGGATAGWMLGQASATDHGFTISKDVANTITDYFHISETSGKVGIGTTSPSQALDVSGSINASGDLTATNITGTLQTAAQPSITSVGTLATADIDGGTLDDVTIGATTAATATFTDITATQGLDVGFAGTSIADRIRIGDASFYADLTDTNAPVIAYDPNDYVTYDRTNNMFKWFSGGAEMVRLDSAANMSVGTTSFVNGLVAWGELSSIQNTGEARFHLYNYGNQAEWKMGQKSGIDHDYYISKIVAGNEFDYLMIDYASGGVGIGTTTPSELLEVNGTAKATTLEFANGKFSVVSAFLVRKSSSQTISNDTGTTVTWETEAFDVGNDFASNEYTAPVTGIYHFDTTINWAVGGSSDLVTYINVNSTAVLTNRHLAVSGNQTSGPAAITVELEQGDKVKVTVYKITGANRDINSGTQESYFSGHLVVQTE
jgi:hypothetical protein